MRLLDYLAFGAICAFMVDAVFNGITRGWIALIQYAPWLPKGTRIVSGFPYSIIAFGAFALYLVYKFGWVGVFVVGFFEEVWEFGFILQGTMVFFPHWYLYIVLNGLPLAVAFIVFRWRGLTVEWKPLLFLLCMLCCYTMVGGQLNYAGTDFAYVTSKGLPAANLPGQMAFTGALPLWVEYAGELFSECLVIAGYFIFKPIKVVER